MATTASSGAERALVERMTAALSHRGPDGSGHFINGSVGFGHRRLAIIDLEGGAQPIANEDGRVTVVYNGEIFNYRELTTELRARGHQFTTSSDSETLVHLFEQYGIDMLARLQGMFAFALHDANTDSVYLVRDRFGIKPLYYQVRNGTLYFASEVRPLLAAGCPADVNRAGVHAFLQTRFAHGDETMFKGIFRLSEGTYLRWRRGEWQVYRYYDNPMRAAQQGMSDAAADELIASSFREAVKAWMIADVPVGAYLSGGVDSSLIVSEMTRLTARTVRTFCVDFEGETSEAEAAAETARAFGCVHTTVYCGVEELLQLPCVIAALEEPVGDAVVVAQYFLSRATRDAGIKTVLTGDGADETLGGYQYLRAIAQAVRWGGRLPRVVAPVAAALAGRLPLRLIESLADIPLGVAEDARSRLQATLRVVPRQDLQELFDLLLALNTPDDLRHIYTDAFFRESALMPRDHLAGVAVGETLIARVLSLQYRKWLPANINLKQDKLCMAHSVENRVPYLDHHFVEQMATIPDRLKISGKRGKVLLRRLAAKRLPPSRANGTKVPFHLPLAAYLKDSRLWDMVEDAVDERCIRLRGFVRPDYVRRLKTRARDGDYLQGKKLMALVILELWHRQFIDRVGTH